MFCEKCGTKLPDSAKFCAKCGAKQGLSDEQNSLNDKTNNVNAKLVPAKCTSCGEQLTVDPVQQAAICPFCNSAYIVEEAIKNYNMQMTEEDMNVANYFSVMQPQNGQNVSPQNDKQKESSIFKYMSKPGGCGKVVLFLFIVLGVLVNLFSSPKEKQDNKPQTSQTQQVQPNQQNADNKTTQRKNFGEINAFWKSMADEMATKKESGYYFRKGVEGLLSKKNSSYEVFHKDGGEAHQIYIHGDFSSDNKNIEKVHVYLLPLQVTNDYSYYGFMGACLVTIRVTSPDLSNKDAQELLKKLQVITDKPKAGKYKVVHNDVEYTFENKIDEKSNDGFEFTVEIAKQNK